MAPLFSCYHEGLTSDNNYIIVSIRAPFGGDKRKDIIKMAKKQAEKISKPGLVGNTNAAVENPRNVVMTVRVTQAELDAAKSNAASYGMGLAQFVRYAIKATRASR